MSTGLVKAIPPVESLDPIREERLMEIRREAESRAQTIPQPAPLVTSPTARADGDSGYYALPLLKPPRWNWEVPAYFYVGGAAGASAVIAAMASLRGSNPKLTRDAQRLATVGGLISPLLLSADLGRPGRFIYMLRVFKPQSPMSVGSWMLAGFSASSVAAQLLRAFSRGSRNGGGLVSGGAQLVSALTGLGLATYTGVLIGATAIPVWSENVGMLPVHFAASGLGTAVGILELAGHQASGALNLLGIGAAAVETYTGGRIELKSDRALRPLKAGKSGWATRIGNLLSGPVPLALRLLAMRSSCKRPDRLRRAAAVSCVTGALLTRAGWVSAGKMSAQDNAIPLQTNGAGQLKE